MRVLNVVGNSYVLGSGIFSIINPLVQELNSKNIETHVLSIDTNQKEVDFPFVFLYKSSFQDSDFDKYDLVLFHGIYYLEFVKISKLLLIRNIPYIIKPHSSLTKASFKKHGIRKYIFLFFFFFFFNKAKGIVYTNIEEKDNSFIFLNKNRYIEMNGIDLVPNVHVSDSNTSKALNLIYLSRIDLSHKGVDVLLDAIEQLLSFFTENNCVINFYGNGKKEDMNYFNRRISEINSERVIFHGPLFGQEKEEVYSKSDIMLLTSRYEGFPTVLIEATMHSIPCIITKGTNGKFISENNAGWCVPEFNVNSIVDTIKKAINEYLINKDYYRKNARLLAEKEFDIKITIEKTIDMYKEIING